MKWFFAWVKSCFLMLRCKHHWGEHWKFGDWLGTYTYTANVEYRYCMNCGMRKP